MTDEHLTREAVLAAIDLEANILTHLLCYRCERHFEQHSESTITDVDLWSRDAATRAMQAGWRFVAPEDCLSCLFRPLQRLTTRSSEQRLAIGPVPSFGLDLASLCR